MKYTLLVLILLCTGCIRPHGIDGYDVEEAMAVCANHTGYEEIFDNGSSAVSHTHTINITCHDGTEFSSTHPQE